LGTIGHMTISVAAAVAIVTVNDLAQNKTTHGTYHRRRDTCLTVAQLRANQSPDGCTNESASTYSTMMARCHRDHMAAGVTPNDTPGVTSSVIPAPTVMTGHMATVCTGTVKAMDMHHAVAPIT